MPRSRTLLLGLAFAALAAAPSHGAVDRPQPCAGLTLADPAGDALYNPLGTAGQLTGAGTEAAPPSLDLTGAFLNQVGGRLTINLAVADLSREMPGGVAATGGVGYYAYWVYDGRVRFVRAVHYGGDDVFYRFGYVTSATHGGDPVGGLHLTEGDTTGSFSEGPGGVVSILIPPEIGGVAGATLAGIGVSAETVEGNDDMLGVNHRADLTPDDLDIASPQGPSHVVKECPTHDVQRSDTGQPALPPVPAAPPPAPAAPVRKLPLRAPATLRIGARRTITLVAGAPMTAVRLSLRPAKGGASVATASARSIKAGRARLRLKPRRRMRTGRYVLSMSGIVDGRRLTATRALRVRR